MAPVTSTAEQVVLAITLYLSKINSFLELNPCSYVCATSMLTHPQLTQDMTFSLLPIRQSNLFLQRVDFTYLSDTVDRATDLTASSPTIVFTPL